jgi:hypothetical protein
MTLGHSRALVFDGKTAKNERNRDAASKTARRIDTSQLGEDTIRRTFSLPVSRGSPFWPICGRLVQN